MIFSMSFGKEQNKNYTNFVMFVVLFVSKLVLNACAFRLGCAMRKPDVFQCVNKGAFDFAMRGSRKCSQGVHIPRRGLTENFNMAKINNLAIPGWGSRPPAPPLDPPMFATLIIQSLFFLNLKFQASSLLL